MHPLRGNFQHCIASGGVFPGCGRHFDQYPDIYVFPFLSGGNHPGVYWLYDDSLCDFLLDFGLYGKVKTADCPEQDARAAKPEPSAPQASFPACAVRKEGNQSGSYPYSLENSSKFGV